MALHARNIAIMAGAPKDIVDEVVKRLVKRGKIRMDIAKEIIDELAK
jgi:hydroxymethylglutaryl-CoA reductase